MDLACLFHLTVTPFLSSLSGVSLMESGFLVMFSVFVPCHSSLGNHKRCSNNYDLRNVYLNQTLGSYCDGFPVPSGEGNGYP